MAILEGVYAAGLSVLKEDLSLDIEKTIEHHEHLIKEGLNGTFFFGSTGPVSYTHLTLPTKRIV